MKIGLISVGTKMPRWVQDGTAEYEKRISKELGFKLIEVPLAKRSKTQSLIQCIEKEGDAILSQLNSDDFVVSLDVLGRSLDTPALAEKIGDVRFEGRNLNLLVGGPDGLSERCQSRANESWSLSALTLPHPLVRVLICEQLYRAACILKGHPYHRE